MLKIDNSNLSSIQYCQLKIWSRGGWQNRELTVKLNIGGLEFLWFCQVDNSIHTHIPWCIIILLIWLRIHVKHTHVIMLFIVNLRLLH